MAMHKNKWSRLLYVVHRRKKSSDRGTRNFCFFMPKTRREGTKGRGKKRVTMSEVARGEHGPEGDAQALLVGPRHRPIDGGGQEPQRA